VGEGERSERPEKVTLTDSTTRVKGLEGWHEKCLGLGWRPERVPRDAWGPGDATGEAVDEFVWRDPKGL